VPDHIVLAMRPVKRAFHTLQSIGVSCFFHSSEKLVFCRPTKFQHSPCSPRFPVRLGKFCVLHTSSWFLFAEIFYRGLLVYCEVNENEVWWLNQTVTIGFRFGAMQTNLLVWVSRA
jgi:hypothetical protein